MSGRNLRNIIKHFFNNDVDLFSLVELGISVISRYIYELSLPQIDFINELLPYET